MNSLTTTHTDALLRANVHRDVRKLIDEAIQERDLSLKEFTSAIKRAARVGALLTLIKKATQHGQWTEVLSEIGIKARTAEYWMEVAAEYEKDPVRVCYLIASGAPICAVWRDEGLQKPCLGAPYDPQTRTLRLSREAAQLSFNFADQDKYPLVMRELIAAPNVEDLRESTLLKILDDLEAAKARIQSVLEKRNAITLNPDHQP